MRQCVSESTSDCSGCSTPWRCGRGTARGSSPSLSHPQSRPSVYSEDQSSLMFPGELTLIKWLSQQHNSSSRRRYVQFNISQSTAPFIWKKQIENRKQSIPNICLNCVHCPTTQNSVGIKENTLSHLSTRTLEGLFFCFGNAEHNLIWFRLSSPELCLLSRFNPLHPEVSIDSLLSATWAVVSSLFTCKFWLRFFRVALLLRWSHLNSYFLTYPNHG